ncbi:TPA: hypothetical protein ACSP2B_001471 [Aeromonas veronii]|uniref:hypothetical protein n=1 Tax=Aeromonas veronii TaxID=654 RepID=UPI003CEEAFC2
MFCWVADFETEFKIKRKNRNEFFIIEGQKPYKQSLGGNVFMVNVPSHSLINSRYITYAYKEVAFLVDDWVKIQDSLEMIFNLICGSSNKSICILAYLRTNNISAWEFSIYLECAHNLMFINRKDALGKSLMVNTVQLLQSLKSAYKVHFLMVGSRGFIRVMRNVNVLGECMHPSGVNLNKNAALYHNIWYRQVNASVVNHLGHINLHDFSVLV